MFTGEGEVAPGLIETILERLGVPAEQIDRERSRAHRELWQASGAVALAGMR